MEKTKRYSKCGEVKAVGEFYKRSTNKDSLRDKCKSCTNRVAKKWYKEHREHSLIMSRNRYKIHLERERMRSAQYYKEHREQKLSYCSKRRKENIEQVHMISSKSYNKHSKRIRAKAKQRYRECPEQREKHQISSAKWYKEHSEQRDIAHRKWQKEHPEKLRIYRLRDWKKHSKQRITKSLEWQKTHPEQKLIIDQRRRALKKSLPATLVLKEWQRTKIECGNCCVYCDIPFTNKLRPIQAHFLALSKGGGYTKENILPACPSCNGRVGNRIFKDLQEARQYLHGKPAKSAKCPS